jgi:hypothetical protein
MVLYKNHHRWSIFFNIYSSMFIKEFNDKNQDQFSPDLIKMLSLTELFKEGLQSNSNLNSINIQNLFPQYDKNPMLYNALDSLQKSYSQAGYANIQLQNNVFILFILIFF